MCLFFHMEAHTNIDPAERPCVHRFITYREEAKGKKKKSAGGGSLSLFFFLSFPIRFLLIEYALWMRWLEESGCLRTTYFIPTGLCPVTSSRCDLLLVCLTAGRRHLYGYLRSGRRDPFYRRAHPQGDGRWTLLFAPGIAAWIANMISIFRTRLFFSQSAFSMPAGSTDSDAQ